VRRRSRRCHLSNDPAAGITYSAAGLIKYSRARVLPHDYPYFADVRPGAITTPTATLKTDSNPTVPCSPTELLNESRPQ